MTAHPGRLRRVVALVFGLVAALVVGLVTVLAVRSDGYATTSVDLTQRSVWVTNAEKFMVGRLNRQINELDSAAILDSPDMDVLQQDDTVVVVDAKAHQARLLDPATVSLGGRLTLPENASIVLGGTQLAVADRGSGAVWIRAAASLSTGDLTTEEPSARLAPGAVLAASADGRIAATAPGAATVTTLSAGSDGPAAATSVPVPGGPLAAAGPADPNPVSISMVGDTAVVLDRPAGRIVVGDRQFSLPPGTVGAVLQQSGPAAGGVLVATDRALLRVDLATGEVSTFDPGSTGRPAAPVWLGSCAHAAWSGSAPTYLQWCGSVPTVRAIPSTGTEPVLKFRVNRDVIVLNDLTAGNTWVLDQNMTVVNNWDAVAPPKQEDAQSSDNGEETSSNQLTTSRTDCSGGMAPPAPVNDAFGVRPGRPTVLRVLDNDTTSNCSMVIVSKVAGLPADKGTVAIVDGGQAVQVTPAAGVSGPLPPITYQVDDGAEHQASATLSVTVAAGNPLPPKQNRKSAVTVEAGGTATYNVAADWTSPSGDALFLISATINNDDDQVTYLPGGNITVDDKNTTGPTKKTVTFLISDGVNPPARGQLIVDVVSEDKATPVASPVYATGLVGEPITINPLQSVISPSTEPLRLAKVDPPKQVGGIKVTPDLDAGQVTVVGARPGSFYLDYQVAAGAGAADGLIRVDIKTPPDQAPPPVPMTDIAFLPTGGEVLVDLTANDVDPSGRALAVQQLTVAPTSGLVVTVSDMHLVRVSARRALPPGGVWFSYAVSSGGASATGWVRVVNVPTPADPVAPSASPIRVSVRAGDAVTVPMSGYAVDPGGDLLTVEPFDAGTVKPGQGLLFTSADAIRYLAPATGVTEPIRTTYTVVNRAGKTDSAALQITVVPPGQKNRAPRTPPVTVARTFVGGTIDIPLPIDAIDPDGDWAILSGIATPAASGRASVAGASTMRYTAFDAAGPDTVSYTVSDPAGAQATGVVKIVVVDRPKSAEPPVAPDIDVTVQPNRSVAVDLLSQVSDPAGLDVAFAARALTTRTTTPAVSYKIAGGVVVLKAGKDNAVEPITYTVVNERGLSATGVLTVTVSRSAPAIPPTASDLFVNDTMVAADRTTATVDITNAIGNPGGLPADLKLSLPQMSAGRMTVSGARALTVPITAARQVIAYQVTNLDDRSAQAFVVIPARDDLVQQPDPTTDRPQPQPPQPDPVQPEVFAPTIRKTLTVDAGTTVTVSLAEYIGGVKAGRSLTLAADGPISVTTGDLARVDSGRVRWAVPADADGRANLTVTVSDGKAKPVRVNIPARITPKVVPPPEFSSAPLSVEAGSSATLDLRPLVTTEDAEQAKSLKFSGPTGAGSGVTASLSGTVLTASAAEDVAQGTTVNLGVTVKDNAGHSVPATVTVTVTGLTAPLATVVNSSIDDAVQGKPSTVNVLDGASNPLEGPLRVVGAEVASGDASASFSGNGPVTVTPAGDQVGRVTVVFTVADASGDETRNVQGTLTATVRGRPARPSTPKVVSVSNGSVVLQWEAPDDHGAPLTGYTISGQGAAQECAKSPCTLTDLTNNRTYNFTVTAHNAVGDSDPSKASGAARPDTAPQAPGAPVLTFGDRQIAATWKAPASNGSPVTKYRVRISPHPQSGSDVVETSDTGAVFKGLANGTQYQVTLVARNDSGTDSDPSPPSSEIPAAVPDVPATPGVGKPEDAGAGGKIVVSWTEVNGNGDDKLTYTVNWSSDQGGKGSLEVEPGKGTSAVIKPIALGANYSARVIATNKAGSSAASPAGTVSPYTAPDVVSDLAAAATGTDGQVSLTWSAPKDNGRPIKGYQYKVDGGGWTPVGADPTAVAVEGLSNGKNHTFVVRACNTDDASNCGGDSKPVPASPYRPADAVGALAASPTPGAGQVTLTWAAPADTGGRPITGYEYQVDGGAWTEAGAAPTATISDLTNGQQYTFAVRSHSDEKVSGEGAPAQVQETPYANPGATAGLSATAAQDSVVLNWTALADSGGRPVASYQYSSDKGASWKDTGNGATATSTVPAAAGSTPTFQVRALHAGDTDPARQVGPASPPATSGTVWGPVGAPTVSAAPAGADGVAFSWSGPAGNGLGPYTYVVNGAGGATSATSQAENPGCGKGASISVVAQDSAGHQGPAGTASGTAKACPPPPQTVTVGKYGNAVGHKGTSPNSTLCAHPSCQFINVTLNNWPNETITCNWSGTTYSPSRQGDGTIDTLWYYGNPGGTVTVSCSSATGGTRTDSLTW